MTVIKFQLNLKIKKFVDILKYENVVRNSKLDTLSLKIKKTLKFK
jgi:hypothetical protein